MTIEEKRTFAEKACRTIGTPFDDFDVIRVDEIGADVFVPLPLQKGGGAIIVGDDETFMICGTAMPIEDYIKEFNDDSKQKIADFDTIMQAFLEED